MKKKLLSMLVLLMVAVTGAWAETTIVTWTSSGSYENNNSRGGVTLSGEVVEYIWDELSGGEWRLAYDSEQGTFTTSLGNFTSIVISGGDIDGFSGTGWNGRTWTGNASSVPFTGYLTDVHGEEPWTITFTIAPAGPTEAQEETLLTTITPTGDGTYSETTAGAVTVTPAGSFFYSGSSYGWRWDSYGSLTVTANEGYTITRCVFIQQGKNQSVTISEAPFELNFEEFVCYENYSMDGVTSIEVYGTAPAAPAASTYTVTLKEGTEDATSWTIAPAEATTTGVAAGTEVKATYGGTKKVKSVKAVKKAPAGKTVDISTLSADYEAQNGDVLTGTLAANVKVSIADGATVTLDGVTINGVNDYNYSWAGLNCLGDATIVLKDGSENTVKGFYQTYPGIYVPENKTVTIQGIGSLTASSSDINEVGGAGIGGGYQLACGNITIMGGSITVMGSIGAAGIGSGSNGSCGNITITGGNITATGGNNGAGIGSGNNGSFCDNITITGGNITATGGNNAAGIGSGISTSCGNITITGGTINATGNGQAAGIGSGYASVNKTASCGTITITTGVTKVTATKGNKAPNSIGVGKAANNATNTCGTVTIGCTLDSNGNPVGGTTGQISTSPYTYPEAN